VRQAFEGDLAEAFARLDACGADAELVGLAKRCLARDPADRPADAGEVARLAAEHRAGVERRLRQAEADQAAAAAREGERRKKRRVQAALAAAVGLIVLGGVLAGWREDRLATERRVEAELVEAERRVEREKADVERAFRERQARDGVTALIALAADLRRQSRFREARDTLAQAEQLLAGGAAADLAPHVARAIDDLAFARELDRIRYQKAVWVPARIVGGRRLDPVAAATRYPPAFRDRGFDVAAGEPAAVAARVRDSAIRTALVEALDDWAAYESDPALRDRVLAVLRLADPGPWLDRFRDPAVRASREAVETLAADADPAALPPAVVVALGILMQQHALDPSGLLARAQVARPGDFDLAVALGLWTTGRGDYPKALGHFRAARAVRPENGAALAMTGILLALTFDVDAAVPTLEEAVRVDPDFAVAWTILGCARALRGDPPGAVVALREAVRLEPTLPHARFSLAIVLVQQKEYAAAVEQYREVIRLDPGFPMAHFNLGQALRHAGDLDAAAEAFRTAAARDPADAAPRRELAGVLIDLGNKRRNGGDIDGAVRAYREAIDRDPTNAIPHYNLGLVWQFERNDPQRAIVAYESAILLDPDHAFAHANLALARLDVGDPAGALADAERAARLAPKSPHVRNTLGWVRFVTGDLDGAAREFEEAARLDPKFARPHNNLGLVWARRGDRPKAAAEFTRAAELDPKWDLPRANLGDLWLRAGDPDRALPEYREAVRLNPNAPGHRVRLAQALGARGEYTAAMNGLKRALVERPGWEHDPATAVRFYLAVYAVRSGLGHGADPVPPEERAALRQRARSWLRAECELRKRLLPAATYRAQMGQLLAEPHLAWVRHPLLLAAVPADEAAEWRAFWDEVRRARDGPEPILAPAPRPTGR
jgi:tetratricopeptide (TPR) repeat protein